MADTPANPVIPGDLDGMIAEVARVVRERQARLVAQFGFVPYGIAINPADQDAVETIQDEAFANLEVPEDLPFEPSPNRKSYFGMRIFWDPHVERGSAEFMNEATAKERYAEGGSRA